MCAAITRNLLVISELGAHLEAEICQALRNVSITVRQRKGSQLLGVVVVFCA